MHSLYKIAVLSTTSHNFANLIVHAAQYGAMVPVYSFDAL